MNGKRLIVISWWLFFLGVLMLTANVWVSFGFRWAMCALGVPLFWWAALIHQLMWVKHNGNRLF